MSKPPVTYEAWKQYQRRRRLYILAVALAVVVPVFGLAYLLRLTGQQMLALALLIGAIDGIIWERWKR